MDRTSIVATLITTVALLGATAAAGGVTPNIIVNGDFEAWIPPGPSEPIQGTALDECIGVGHQAFYGSGTWQQRAENSAVAASENDTDGAAENVTAAGDQIGKFPVQEALFLSGYGYCVFSDEEGVDVAWLNPAKLARDDAVHWSTGDSTLVDTVDADADREARIAADTSLSDHNMWQAWSSPHQAYTADFDALEFDVEDGAISDKASVQVSLSATPLEEVTPWVAVFLDCSLNFNAAVLQDHQAGDGRVAVDPAEANLVTRGDACDPAAQNWTAADHDERHAILSHLRIVQVSFWGFNHGELDPSCECAIQIDNVAIFHASSAAEAAPGTLV